MARNIGLAFVIGFAISDEISQKTIQLIVPVIERDKMSPSEEARIMPFPKYGRFDSQALAAEESMPSA